MKPDPAFLLQLVSMKMPYGKHKGIVLCDLPTYYLEWFDLRGFPKGRLGELLQTMHEIRQNRLEYLLEPLKNNPIKP